jgi:hypothetical protein
MGEEEFSNFIGAYVSISGILSLILPAISIPRFVMATIALFSVN